MRVYDKNMQAGFARRQGIAPGMAETIATLNVTYLALIERISRLPMTPAGRAAILADIEANYQEREAANTWRTFGAVTLKNRH